MSFHFFNIFKRVNCLEILPYLKMALRLICIARAANVTDGLSLLHLVYHVDEAVLKNFFP